MRPLEPPRRVRDFVPPHCPNPDCPAHHVPAGTYRSFQRRGFRMVDRRPGWVRKFSCKLCKRWFSSSSFSEDYWKRRTGVNEAIDLGLANGQALRQIARSRHLSLSLVRCRERQLAKQALLHHEQQLQQLEGRLDEPVVLDGFRTFAMSQYEPLDLNTPITADSRYLLDLRAAPLRRSGTMTERQKVVRRKRDLQLGRPESGIRVRITRENLRLIDRLAPPGRKVELRMDLEPDYVTALNEEKLDDRFELTRVSSKERRDMFNPLWAVNQLHAMLRHSLKSHARETLAFHKRLRGLMDRALITRTWLNVSKGLSERRGVPASKVTPAMKLGLCKAALTARDVFRQRLFPGRVGLPESLKPLYEGALKARPRETLRVLPLKYAY